jgi:peptidoglycan/LPS O-acetylase OafA/YrhL
MIPSKGVQYHAAFIDGLRAVAVLSVIIYHLNPALLPGGFVGVDIFFVISGFVVSYSISEFAPLGAWRSLTRFYARRFARIIPALLVCLLITFLLWPYSYPTPTCRTRTMKPAVVRSLDCLTSSLPR